MVDEKEQVVEVRVFVDGKGSMELLPNSKAVVGRKADEHGCWSVSPESDDFDCWRWTSSVCARNVNVTP